MKGINEGIDHLPRQSELYDIRDLARIMAKVATKKVNGPDLINLANSVISFKKIKMCVFQHVVSGYPFLCNIGF